MELLHRPRRLRTSEAVREMARETRLSKKALVYPVFIREGSGIREEIPSLPGQYHYSPMSSPEQSKNQSVYWRVKATPRRSKWSAGEFL